MKTSGGDGTLSIGALVSADIPDNAANTTGNAATATTATTTKLNTETDGIVKTSGGDGTLSIGALVSADIPDNAANTTGNAASATKLETARTIAGVSFDGSANIDLSLNGFSDAKAGGVDGAVDSDFGNSILMVNPLWNFK